MRVMKEYFKMKCNLRVPRRLTPRLCKMVLAGEVMLPKLEDKLRSRKEILRELLDNQYKRLGKKLTNHIANLILTGKVLLPKMKDL